MVKEKEDLSPHYLAKCYKTLKQMNAPLKGWVCEEVEDNEADNFVCELCGCVNVRFIHVMRHKDYPGFINVGCICAGLLEGDILAAKNREREARLRSKRKKTFMKTQWTYPEKDVWKATYKGRKVQVNRHYFHEQKYYVANIDGKLYHRRHDKRMRTMMDAKYLIFEVIDAEIMEGKKAQQKKEAQQKREAQEAQLEREIQWEREAHGGLWP